MRRISFWCVLVALLVAAISVPAAKAADPVSIEVVVLSPIAIVQDDMKAALVRRDEVIAALKAYGTYKVCTYADTAVDDSKRTPMVITDSCTVADAAFLIRPLVIAGGLVLAVFDRSQTQVIPDIHTGKVTDAITPMTPELLKALGTPAAVNKTLTFRSDPRPTLVVFPASAATNEQTTAATRRTEAISAIASYGFYHVCAYDANDDPAKVAVENCDDPLGARFRVHPSIDAKGEFDLSVLDTDGPPVSTIDVGAAGTPVDAATPALYSTFGKPKIIGSELHLGIAEKQYQQFVQVVPIGGDAALYMDDVIHMLERRGVAAIASNISGAALAPSNPASAICDSGQNYFAFVVRITQDVKKIIGTTRVGAQVNGWLFDCPNKFLLRDLGADDKRIAFTPANSLASYLMVLIGFQAFTHVAYAPHVSNGLPILAGFVQDNPNDTDYKHNVGEIALQRLIDKLCVTAKVNYSNTPINHIPGLTATGNLAQRSGGRGFKGADSTVGGGPGTTPAATPAELDVASLTSPYPYHVDCNDSPRNDLHKDAPTLKDQFDGWLTEVQTIQAEAKKAKDVLEGSGQ